MTRSFLLALLLPLAAVLLLPGAAAQEPIGTILGWHNDMPGTPLLPEGWVRCDGQIVDDEDSPYHGVILPDLNYGRRFLRGGATSGVLQDDAMQGHHHQVSHDAHTVTNVPDWGGVGWQQVTIGSAWIGISYPMDDGANGAPRTSNETRPVNAATVWIIKTKASPVPIGAVAAWHRDLPGTPPLPPGWVECNGQTITDIDSPYYNGVVPDMNGERRFLRGAGNAGPVEGDVFQGHFHEALHDSVTVYTYGPVGTFDSATLGEANAVMSIGDPISDGLNGAPRTGPETRPINMSVIWVMKIKPSSSPVGAIVGWHRDLPGTPPLLPTSLPCNGQTIADIMSPYLGLALPDLNGTARFLRGGDTSGVLQTDTFQGHRHSVLQTAVRLISGVLFSGSAVTTGYHHEPATIIAGDPIDDGWNGEPRTANETRPDNMSVVWVMTTKHPWRDMGGSVAGTVGVPVLIGTGPMVEWEPYSVELTNVAVGSSVHLVLGLSAIGAPFKGGILVPKTDVVVYGLPTFGGELLLGADWPPGIPGGVPLYWQYWIPDGGAVFGFAASNGLEGISQDL